MNGYHDIRQQYVMPPVDRFVRRNKRPVSRPSGHVYECRNGKYELGQSLKMGTRDTDGAGECDKRVTWRCDCGAEIDCDDERCRRCGSERGGELR